MDPRMLHFLLAAIVLYAAVSKLRNQAWHDFASAVQVLTGLERPFSLYTALVVLLAELTTAGLLLSSFPNALVGPLAYIGLVTAFTAVVLVGIARGSAVSCACFGRHSSGPLRSATIIRNLGLLTLGFLTVLADSLRSDPSLRSLQWAILLTLSGLTSAALFGVGLLAERDTEHSSSFEPPPGDLFDDAIGLQVGDGFPAPRSQTVDGAVLTSDYTMAGRLLVGYFVANCPGCLGAVNVLTSATERLAAHPLAAVAGSPHAAEGLVRQLTDAAVPTLSGREADLFAQASRVEHFPTFTLFEDGTVVSSGHSEEVALAGTE